MKFILNKLLKDDPNYILDLLIDEEFKRINILCYPEIEDNRYWISNKNRIYDERKGLKIPSHCDPGKTSSPYYSITLNTRNGLKTFLMHRLLMMTFNPLESIEDMKRLQINHKDGDKLNNELWNLEWVTQRENTLHAYYNGLFVPAYGETHCCATIKEKDAKKICELLVSRKFTYKEIANIVGTTKTIVMDIAQRNSWKHISKDYDFSSLKHRLPKNFTFEQIHQCCKYFQDHPRKENQSIRNYIIECLNGICYEGKFSEANFNSIRLLYDRKRYEFISCKYNFK